jgi:hypothetical protein
MPGGDEIGDVQRAAWAGLSAGWGKWDSVIMDQLGPVGTAITGRLDIADDQQHLDIAAGTGEPGLTVAKLAPRGHVVLTDLAAEMLDIATRRVNAQGITMRGSSPQTGWGWFLWSSRLSAAKRCRRFYREPIPAHQNSR